MSVIRQAFTTITCNGVGCANTVTFEDSKQQEVANETPWMRTIRVVQTGQGRNFVYCSDSCELSNVGAGAHNPEERKVIAFPQGANAMEMAAAQAKAAENATKSLKEGSGVTIHRG